MKTIFLTLFLFLSANLFSQTFENHPFCNKLKTFYTNVPNRASCDSNKYDDISIRFLISNSDYDLVKFNSKSDDSTICDYLSKQVRIAYLITYLKKRIFEIQNSTIFHKLNSQRKFIIEKDNKIYVKNNNIHITYTIYEMTKNNNIVIYKCNYSCNNFKVNISK